MSPEDESTELKAIMAMAQQGRFDEARSRCRRLVKTRWRWLRRGSLPARWN